MVWIIASVHEIYVALPSRCPSPYISTEINKNITIDIVILIQNLWAIMDRPPSGENWSPMAQKSGCVILRESMTMCTRDKVYTCDGVYTKCDVVYTNHTTLCTPRDDIVYTSHRVQEDVYTEVKVRFRYGKFAEFCKKTNKNVFVVFDMLLCKVF